MRFSKNLLSGSVQMDLYLFINTSTCSSSTNNSGTQQDANIHFRYSTRLLHTFFIQMLNFILLKSFTGSKSSIPASIALLSAYCSTLTLQKVGIPRLEILCRIEPTNFDSSVPSSFSVYFSVPKAKPPLARNKLRICGDEKPFSPTRKRTTASEAYAVIDESCSQGQLRRFSSFSFIHNQAPRNMTILARDI